MGPYDCRNRDKKKSHSADRLRVRMNRKYGHLDNDDFFALLKEERDSIKEEVDRWSAYVNTFDRGDFITRGMRHRLKLQVTRLAHRGARWRDFDPAAITFFPDICDHFLAANWDVIDDDDHPRAVIGGPNA